MYSVDTNSVKSYVDAPKFLLKRRTKMIALIADGGNHYIAYGIVEGTTLFVDLEADYVDGTLSCFISSDGKFKLSDTDLQGYEYVGRVVATYKDFEV